MTDLANRGNLPPYNHTSFTDNVWVKICTLDNSGDSNPAGSTTSRMSTGFFNAPCGLVVIKPSISHQLAGDVRMTVKSGDYLGEIASRFKRDGVQVEAGTIMVLNRIRNAKNLQVDQTIKVPVAPITAVLEKDSYALMVFVGDQLLRLYWVGHGKNDHTPVTEFEVLSKHEKPDWTAPDGNVYPYAHPENVLGEYFIKFGHRQYTGFGAHSTPDLATIHTMSSAGCIRMKPGDIDELFRLLPIGAKVVVRDTAAR